MLPKEVKTKIYKTGQTRGADDDVIYQNRVGRNSTVLIPFEEYPLCKDTTYENGFIVLIKPETYFSEGFDEELKKLNLVLGENLLVFYETRKQWETLQEEDHSRNYCEGNELLRKEKETSLGVEMLLLETESEDKKGRISLVIGAVVKEKLKMKKNWISQ